MVGTFTGDQVWAEENFDRGDKFLVFPFELKDLFCELQVQNSRVNNVDQNPLKNCL